MNNESINFSKIITTVSNTCTSAPSNCSNTIINSSANSATQFSSISSSLSLASSCPQPYSTSVQFDVTVNAIAAVVNASNNLPATTPPNAAAVVAVAVSSLAAAIIPDTPIVSIAGSTLSEITTTTTSTKTTPTPIPTSKETENNNNSSSSSISNTNNNRNLNKEVPNKTLSSSSSSTVNPSSSLYSTSRATVKGLAPMSVAKSSATGALSNASTAATHAGAAETKNNTNSIKQIKDISSTSSAKGSFISCGTVVTKSDSLVVATESKSVTAAPSTSQPVVANANVATSKTNDSNVTPNQTKSKDSISESWEESRLKDWDDSKLKELLDEAYSYKNPRDKENKSKTFLQLLEKAENEDQSYPFCVTSRGTRNLSNSITSNIYHHYQSNSHYHSHSHNHNRSHHHHHKQGGSLQDLFEIGLHESPLDCEQAFGIGISGNQRTRRQNHNSRQKKYSSSVSSRQREGGSLPSNVNVTHQLSLGGSGGGVVNDISLLQQDTNTNKSNKKEQRRNATATKSTSTSNATVCSDVKENFSNSTAAAETVATNKTTTTTTTHPTYTASGGDFIIDMGEPMMDIQQQQKILQCKGQDAATQGHPFYERLSNNDKRIPRANIIGSTKATYFAPTTSHCYVDETVRFNALERNGNSNNGPSQSTIDAKFLPLDENYKSCKSVLGSEGDKSPELLSKTKSNTIYTKISTPASGTAILTGTTNNIATLTQRQLDENGNALSEIYQNSTGTAATIQINAVSATNADASAVALLNSCGNVSTSATVTISPHTASTTVSTSATVTTTFTSGPSQAKAKAKKKSQQERNTKTVDVESVAGYRGKDPVEELVKYIESSGEDKQSGTKSAGDKKKERKKDKEKHQKLKKSNSLEELRSGAKMEVHELKRTAATTESNTVLVRQKPGGGGGGSGGKKNNSSSTADINKNLDKNSTNPRKSERRSWGNEDLKYLEDQQNTTNLINEEKTSSTGNSIKEKKNKIGANNNAAAGSGGSAAGIIVTSKEEKEIKDKTNERNERNLSHNITNSAAAMPSDKLEKVEKLEKSEKSEKSDKLEKIEKVEKSENKLEKRKKQTDIPPNAVTVVDILAIESVLPETAEFHVVTKKKKPKKQKIINNLEETTVTFNRTHNFTMQKTSTFNQQQQQMTVRYKYYHHDNTSANNNINNSTNNMNTNSQHNQQPNIQQQHQQTSTNNTYTQNSQPAQQTTTSENYTAATTSDKSRRKSTSSVPPSEKSDSSDLDSVHSLPIEAITKANQTNSAVNVHKTKTQNRTKPLKNNNALMGGKTVLAAPISYADIARTNKEIADAAANTGTASVILINNNEISLESRNADTSLVSNENASNSEEKLLVTGGNNLPTATQAANTTVNSANSKIHKIKKSQLKQDFPELSSSTAILSDDHKLSTTGNNHKTITYSQSLTTVQNTNSSSSTVSGNCIANDALHIPSIEQNTKASPTEQQKNVIVHQQAHHIPPPQHPQQQILPKSKSVDTDNINSSNTLTSSSLSSNATAINAGSSTYMASLNSNNLDQQYPALEKTVKRHTSATNTIMGTPTANNSQQTPFNFAAAAKQQINNNNSNIYNEQQHNINKNSNLTTSNTNNNNNNTTNQAALLAANKKSKEKTPPLTTPPAPATQQITVDNNNLQITTTPTTATASVTAQTNPKKTKKERQQQLQQQQSVGEINLSKQNQNNNLNQKKSLKNALKSSNSLPVGLNSSLNNNSSSTIQNRPAVIILNDYRNAGQCMADNQFTFGDFNEEELKLFDDDHHSAVNDNLTENTSDINLNQTQDEEKHQCMTKNEAHNKTPSITYFNDSGTSCGINDMMVNNSSSEMLLSSSIEASSPNTSFNNNNNTNGASLNQTAHNNNQSSDSGIYTDKTKLANNSSSSLLKTPTNSNEDNDKLNSFLSKTRCASQHNSMDNLAQVTTQQPPPQQLETCNDIETAIIAAARAAAKKQQPYQQQQQQQSKNSNNSSNSSSFSSTSLNSSSASTAYQQQQHHHQQPTQPSISTTTQHHQLSHTNNSNSYGRSNINHMSSYNHPHQSKQTTSQQQQQQQYDEDYVNNGGDDDVRTDSFSNDNNNTPRSRSPSRPRRISIAGGTVVNKEFDIHFIPPTTMPTAFSTQQHNDIIVDFIGSAWEEVANSKVTKVYDGQ